MSDYASRARGGRVIAFAPPPGECQFPHGEVGADTFRYCGAAAVLGKPYCAEHCRLCYRRPDEDDG